MINFQRDTGFDGTIRLKKEFDDYAKVHEKRIWY